MLHLSGKAFGGMEQGAADHHKVLVVRSRSKGPRLMAEAVAHRTERVGSIIRASNSQKPPAVTVCATASLNRPRTDAQQSKKRRNAGQLPYGPLRHSSTVRRCI
ncbi:hypothetical protein BKA81DRAFT_112607 [Phyllosticta paracitricarpa]